MGVDPYILGDPAFYAAIKEVLESQISGGDVLETAIQNRVAELGGGGLLTTKGDLLTHSGTAATKLTAGSPGEVLQADPGAPNGIKFDSVPVAPGAVIAGTYVGDGTSSPGQTILTGLAAPAKYLIIFDDTGTFTAHKDSGTPGADFFGMGGPKVSAPTGLKLIGPDFIVDAGANPVGDLNAGAVLYHFVIWC